MASSVPQSPPSNTPFFVKPEHCPQVSRSQTPSPIHSTANFMQLASQPVPTAFSAVPQSPPSNTPFVVQPEHCPQPSPSQTPSPIHSAANCMQLASQPVPTAFSAERGTQQT